MAAGSDREALPQIQKPLLFSNFSAAPLNPPFSVPSVCRLPFHRISGVFIKSGLVAFIGLLALAGLELGSQPVLAQSGPSPQPAVQSKAPPADPSSKGTSPDAPPPGGLVEPQPGEVTPSATLPFNPPPRPPLPTGEENPYLGELLQKARQTALWDQRYWHLLLHYRKGTLWGYTSEADGQGFFNSPDGKTDPQAELEATLAAFFSPAVLEPGNMTAQCTFPARYLWLKTQLNVDPAKLPPENCPRFEKWRASLDPDSLTFIYSSFYFNNPASMFGHTLLRLDKKGRTEEQRLLDYAVNYAAVVADEDNGATFAFLGVFGGYQGHFSMLPYYMKVREYNDMENRDMWEYRLTLNAEQLDRIVRHIWEQGSTYYDYFFFRENCSYHLLSLLEVADPELDLTDDYFLWTLPTDTVHAVTGVPGLVGSVVFRPSRRTQFDKRMALLTPEEQSLMFQLAKTPESSLEESFTTRPLERKALILDAAADLLYFRQDPDNPEELAENKARLRPLLVGRSRLNVISPELEFNPRPPAVEEGHDSSRAYLGGGGDNNGHAFAEYGAQASFHDLLSLDHGFAQNSQVNLIHLTARYDATARHGYVERFDVADIVSLMPLSPLDNQLSWHLRWGWQRQRDLPCGECLPFIVDGGAGYSVKTEAWKREVTYLMVEPVMQFGYMFKNGSRGGLGATLGMLVDVADGWRVGLSASKTAYSQGPSPVGRAGFHSRWAPGRNLEIRLDANGVQNYQEASLSLGYWF